MRDFYLGKDEAVIVDGEIKVTVIEIDGDEVTLAIDIPEWIGIGETESSHSIAHGEQRFNFFRVLIFFVFGWKERIHRHW